MQPRILYRTHYQVDEPAMMSFIIRHCTSAVESNYSERVAERLSRYVSNRGRGLNVAAAGYAVDLARDLGVLSENNSWTDKGHLIALNRQGGVWRPRGRLGSGRAGAIPLLSFVPGC